MLAVHRNTVMGMLTKLGAVGLHRGEGKHRCIRIPEQNLIRYIQGSEIVPDTAWRIERR